MGRKEGAWSKVVGDWGSVPVILQLTAGHSRPTRGSEWVGIEAPPAQMGTALCAAFPAASILERAEGELRSAGEPGVGVVPSDLVSGPVPFPHQPGPTPGILRTAKEERETEGGAFLGSGSVPRAQSAM